MLLILKVKLVLIIFICISFRVDEKLGIKIADFGLSRDVHYQDYYRLTHKAMVPVKWLAIESLLDRIFNEKTDVVS